MNYDIMNPYYNEVIYIKEVLLVYEGMKPEKRHVFIELLIRREWEMFKKVDSMDGQVGCQEDWPTFHIMRYSYYDAWSDKMIKSYSRDIEEASDSDRNLVMEKYAYMMEFTDPEYYNQKLSPYLPKIDNETRAMIDEISSFIVSCEKAFALKYPRLSSKGRPIMGSLANGGDTSTEIYAKGELRTYSKYTLKYFLDYVNECKSKDINFTFLVKDKMVKMYEYSSVEDAESKM